MDTELCWFFRLNLFYAIVDVFFLTKIEWIMMLVSCPCWEWDLSKFSNFIEKLFRRWRKKSFSLQVEIYSGNQTFFWISIFYKIPRIFLLILSLDECCELNIRNNALWWFSEYASNIPGSWRILFPTSTINSETLCLWAILLTLYQIPRIFLLIG